MNILNTIIQKPNTNIYQAKQQNKQDAKQNIFAPIATTSLIKPDRPQKSYIIRDPFYMAPINFATDIKENVINIAKATTGKSNDHDLGRINDFSMKAGALALAGYLFTHGKTSLSKSMEFVGFGAFFASMALWPKLFIQTPLKAMYGIDIHQRYMDNEGRKKMFFQDPQYIPWDLYTDEQLAQLGDKLGVPRDIHNRNEIIKKKAHKIALQGNTLWMLTAGFATPLMCALMCNGFERIVTPRSEHSTFPNNVFGAFASSIEKMRAENVENKLKKANATAAQQASRINQRELESFLHLLEGEELTSQVLEKITAKLHYSTDVLESETVEKQIRALLPVETTEQMTNKSYVETFWDLIKSTKHKGQMQTAWDNLFTDFEEFKKLSIKDGKELSIIDFVDELEEHIFNKNADNEAISDIFGAKIKEIADTAQDINTTGKSVLDPIKSQKITKEFAAKVLQLDRKLHENFIRLNALDAYERVFFGDIGDSIATNRWINTGKAFFNILGYSKQEIETAKSEGKTAIRLLQSKLETLVTDEARYEAAVRKVQQAILDFDRVFLPDTADGKQQGFKKACSTLIDDYAQRMGATFKEAGFDIMSERIVGNNTSTLGSLQANLHDRMERRIEGLRSGLYKLLHALDFFKRVSRIKNKDGKIVDCDFVRTYRNPQKFSDVPINITDEQILKDIARYKKIVLDATIAQHTTKFGMKNSERSLYIRLMDSIYSENLDESTKKALGILDKNSALNKLGETTFGKSFIDRIKETKAQLGNFKYPHASKLCIDTNFTVKDALTRDALLGKRISHFVKETASELHNSSKWLGKFGWMSAALVGVTLLSQVFFGKISKQDLEYVRKDNN